MKSEILESGTLCGRTIGDVIGAHTERTPEAAAMLSHGRTPLTYGRLAQEIETVRDRLNGWGIGRGNHVALIIGSRPEALLAYLCVANVATVIPLNPEATAEELRVCLSRVEVDAAIVSEGLDVAEQVAGDLGHMVLRLSQRKDDAVGLFDLTGGTVAPVARPGAPESADIAMIQMTSGTTSMPKALPLSHALVTRRGACEAAAMGLTTEDRCLNFRPAHLHGALNAGLMATIAVGGGVVVPEDFDADAFYRDLRDLGVTWYTGGPVYHEALLKRAPFYRDVIDGSRLRLVRSASYSLSPDLMAKLEATLGVVCLERYGGSESGLISRNPPPPAVRKSGTAGVPFDNEVAILDDDGCALAPGELGEIAVRGPNVFAGYEDNAAATASVLVDGWYRTGDLGQFDEDGYLTVSGRISEVINRGGQKISPNEVEAILTLNDDVRECICFPMPHRTLGHVVGAAVALHDGSEFDSAALRDHLRTQLAQYKVPDLIVNCDEIPRGPGGKLQRLKAAERLGLCVFPSSQIEPQTPGRVSPRQISLMKSLADLWCEVLQLDSIGDNENFILLGGDSLQMAELMVGIEARFGIRIPVEIIFEAPTIATLAKHIESDAATNSNNLVTIREAEQAPSIVCIHGGSGDILWGFAFAPHLSVEYGVYGCRWTNALAGDKETIETLAKHYCDAIEQSDMPKPIALVGYSSGGLIAFEMARQLRARGEDPAAVVILDIPTPAARNIWWPIVRHLREAFEGPVSELVPTLVRRAGNVLGRRYAPLRRVRERIWGREDGKLKPVKNIYTRAVQAYAPPPYDGDVMLVSATREAPIWRPKRDMGWADVVHGRLDIHEIDATHLTIVTEPVMRNWAQAVADYIGASADGSPPFPVE